MISQGAICSRIGCVDVERTLASEVLVLGKQRLDEERQRSVKLEEECKVLRAELNKATGRLEALEKKLHRHERQQVELTCQVLSDDKALFIAWKIYRSEAKTLSVGALDKHLRGAAGWIPLAKLAAAGVVSIFGEYACLTPKGEHLIETLEKFSLDNKYQ